MNHGHRYTRLTGAAVAALFLTTMSTTCGADPQLYDVELIVFKNLINQDGGELWPSATVGEPYDPAPVDSPLSRPASVDWLPQSVHRLNAQFANLRRSANYRPLAYYAWRQPVMSRGQAVAVQLPASEPGADGAYVDGSASVAVGRYLHLHLDLQLHEAGAENRSYGTTPAVSGAREYRLNEKRRMRSKELHYFDNPRLGVLALITPYRAAGSDNDAGGEEADDDASAAPSD
jgi:hypothetical protein